MGEEALLLCFLPHEAGVITCVVGVYCPRFHAPDELDGFMDSFE